MVKQATGEPKIYLLLLANVHLETDDVSILYLTLSEGQLWLHELDHARFDFL